MTEKELEELEQEELEKGKRLYDLDIREVSFVDRPANRERFLIVKMDKEACKNLFEEDKMENTNVAKTDTKEGIGQALARVAAEVEFVENELEVRKNVAPKVEVAKEELEVRKGENGQVVIDAIDHLTKEEWDVLEKLLEKIGRFFAPFRFTPYPYPFPGMQGFRRFPYPYPGPYPFPIMRAENTATTPSATATGAQNQELKTDPEKEKDKEKVERLLKEIAELKALINKPT